MLNDSNAPAPHSIRSPDSGDLVDIEHQRSRIVRKPPPAKFGAIDVGSNSVHLVMAEITPEGTFRIIGRDKDMVRLGEGGFSDHRLTDRAMNDGLAALTRFAKMAALKGVTRLRAVATAAVREATNGGDFVERVRDQLGIQLHVISPEEEARLIYLAVRHTVDLGDHPNLIVDIGGGSVEVLIGTADQPLALTSVKLGSSRLAELFIRSDPPTIGELKTLRRYMESQLRPVLRQIGSRRPVRCIGTSGTIENIATVLAYRRGTREIESTNQLRMTRPELKALLAELAGLTRAERRALHGLESARVDSIIPGTMLLHTLLKVYDLPGLDFCDMALREGIILDHLARQRAHLVARAMWPDPRTRSVIELGERCGYRAAHAEQVARLASSLFDQLGALHELPARYRELLRFACLLHDIGYLISHKGHHKHSYYLIRNGGLKGFEDQEIELIANLARYHRKGRPKKSHYSFGSLAADERRALRSMIPMLRLANALDRTHYSVVEAVSCEMQADRIRIGVRSDKDVELELWTAKRQSAAFEDAFGRPLDLYVERPEPREAPGDDECDTDRDRAGS